MSKDETQKKSKTLRIGGIIVAVILGLLIIVAARYLAAFNGFLDKITERKPEMKQYGVLVLNESEVSEVSQLEEKSVGFLKTDETAVKAEQKLQETVKIKADYYEGLDLLTEVLNSRVTDAIVLETDRIEALKEEAENAIEDTRVIYTFEVEIDGQAVEATDKEVNNEPTIVYISGSDSRTGIKTTARSDVNILAVINPKKGKILLVSIPRDTYVQLHGTTGIKDKLTHAGIYGVNMSKTTIEDFLGVAIDYTLKVSFDTVVKVVDEIDGVEINSDQALTLKTNGHTCEFIEGKQEVNGECALRFARERKSYATGDRHRGENQQEVITAIINKLTSSKNYLLKVPAILDIAADSFETTIPRDDIAEFVRKQLTNPTNWQIESISVDGVGTYEPTYSMGANRPLYVMIANEESVKKAVDKINEYLEK